MVKISVMNFVVIAEAQVTPYALETQLRSLYMKELKKNYIIVLTDRKMKVPKIVEAICISHGLVISPVECHVCSPLTTNAIPEECLTLFSHNPDMVLRRFITAYLTLLHNNTPGTEQHSK